jgi:hypothetical protein
MVLFFQMRKLAARFLIRDSDGDAVQAGRGKINNLLSAFQAELIACLQEVQAAADLLIGQ